ncbi:DUF397 domain-containing protein [Micromonospora sp. NPDC050417]|uniref:DUF397 domain-containing protein n=1 Tax=Micromonospora sp. NPDC050417 TaxID=3364280 RepID=UPI003795B881
MASRQTEAAWRKSSRSSSNGQCTEVRDRNQAVDVRDSKDLSGLMLTFQPEAWSKFVDGVKSGRFSG